MERRILVVEDEPLTRGLLASALTGAGFAVSAAGDAAAAAELVADVDPDGLVVDIELGPGPTGLDLVSAVLPAHPHLGVVFLTRVPDARFVGGDQPAASPNVAWLRKQDLADPNQLVAALEAVLQDRGGPALRNDLNPQRPLAHLSRSQVALLRLVAGGLSNEEIANRRGTSVRAVETLIQRTFAAAGIQGADGANPRVLAVRLIASEAALPL